MIKAECLSSSYASIDDSCVGFLRNHRRSNLRQQRLVNLTALCVLPPSFSDQLQPRNGYNRRFRRIEHRTFRYSQNGMLSRK